MNGRVRRCILMAFWFGMESFKDSRSAYDLVDNGGVHGIAFEGLDFSQQE